MQPKIAIITTLASLASVGTAAPAVDPRIAEVIKLVKEIPALKGLAEIIAAKVASPDAPILGPVAATPKTTPTTGAPAGGASGATAGAPAGSAGGATAPAGGSSPSDSKGPQAKDVYTFYQGDGSTAAGWPSEQQWASFDSLWKINLPFIQKSCTNLRTGAPDNSPQEIEQIKKALADVSKEAGIDKRVGLALMMQESKGCVRIGTTAVDVENPGLLQSHKGVNCIGKVPCPQATIKQMIKDGLEGTQFGDGLKQTIAQGAKQLNAKGAQAVYAGARGYNSGSIKTGDLNFKFKATACYATDIANRLTGWIASPSKCKLDG
ncbi:hypothetical protein VHEMI09322 [[Torrubiella] hemipterigena]|uniref:Glycoside hydrolase n=1 Tax=[Torrubiella] hemipterigena TaxID=1531966 RepID=A0A0A1TRB8_9HYPO|nr:hypothetical protein VHEMI09322 [[Torrubiella] hemipterigena]